MRCTGSRAHVPCVGAGAPCAVRRALGLPRASSIGAVSLLHAPADAGAGAGGAWASPPPPPPPPPCMEADGSCACVRACVRACDCGVCVARMHTHEHARSSFKPCMPRGVCGACMHTHELPHSVRKARGERSLPPLPGSGQSPFAARAPHPPAAGCPFFPAQN